MSAHPHVSTKVTPSSPWNDDHGVTDYYASAWYHALIVEPKTPVNLTPLIKPWFINIGSWNPGVYIHCSKYIYLVSSNATSSPYNSLQR